MKTSNTAGAALARRSIRERLAIQLLAVLFVGLAGCATGTASPTANLSPPPILTDAGEDLGIRVTSLHLSAHGSIIDLRYRVLNAEKAALLLDGKQKVYLVDDAHGGAKLGVPESPIIGGMRQTSRNHVIYTDRDYFILFVNPGKAVHVGDTLKLAVGDKTFNGLKVQ